MKIAFCFLITDNISQPEIWLKFFKDSLTQTKYPKPITFTHGKERDLTLNKFIKKSFIPSHIKTAWGDSSLVLALLHLADDALQAKADWIIFLSGHCVPLQPYTHIYEFLEKSNNLSWFQPQHMNRIADYWGKPMNEVRVDGNGQFAVGLAGWLQPPSHEGLWLPRFADQQVESDGRSPGDPRLGGH